MTSLGLVGNHKQVKTRMLPDLVTRLKLATKYATVDDEAMSREPKVESESLLNSSKFRGPSFGLFSRLKM